MTLRKARLLTSGAAKYRRPAGAALPWPQIPAILAILAILAIPRASSQNPRPAG